MKRYKEKSLPSSANPTRERSDFCVSRKKRYGSLPADPFKRLANDELHEKFSFKQAEKGLFDSQTEVFRIMASLYGPCLMY